MANLELRLRVWKGLGFVGAWDSGRIWDSFTKVGTRGWSGAPALGLRWMFQTFLVRADLGLGSDSTGFYISFGEAF
jgi:outer membrane translocation and assembly module TamA